MACYAGATCGDTPDHLPTVDDCCLQNTSALISYRSASNPDSCWPCLGNALSIQKCMIRPHHSNHTSSSYINLILPTVVGFAQSQYHFEENTNPHQLSVKVLSPPQSIIELTGITFTATDGTAISKFHN